MRAVVQRVTRAKVTVADACSGTIGPGLLVLLGVGEDDTDRDVAYLADKISGLRIFDDEEGKMNMALPDIQGAMLVISQFTLYGDCRKGKRPSYAKAAKPDWAEALYEKFVDEIRKKGIPVETGVFQAEMMVELVNDGPVTIMVDSKKDF